MGPLANVRTKKPGGVSRRSDSTVALSFCVASDGDDLDPRFRTMRPEACSVFSPVQWFMATGLLSHPPGSAGRVSRPARIKVLCGPPAASTHRFCKRTWGGWSLIRAGLSYHSGSNPIHCGSIHEVHRSHASARWVVTTLLDVDLSYDSD